MEVNSKLFELADEILDILLTQRPGHVTRDDLMLVQTWLCQHGSDRLAPVVLAGKFMRERSQMITPADKLRFVESGIWPEWEMNASEAKILSMHIERLEALRDQVMASVSKALAAEQLEK